MIRRSLTNLNHFPFLLIWFGLCVGCDPLVGWNCSRWDVGLTTPIIPLPPVSLVIITKLRLVEKKVWPLVGHRLRLGLWLLHLEVLKTFGCFLVENSAASRAQHRFRILELASVEEIHQIFSILGKHFFHLLVILPFGD